MSEKNNDMLDVIEALVSMNGGEAVMTLTARDVYYWIKMVLKDGGGAITKTSYDENSLLNFLDTYYTLSGSKLSAENKEVYKNAYDYVNNHYSCIYSNAHDPRIKTCSEFFIKGAAVILNQELIYCMYCLKHTFGKPFYEQHELEFSIINDILHNSDATYGNKFSADYLCFFLDECQKKIKGIINEEIECIDRIKRYITDHYCYISTDAEGGFTVHLPDNLFNPNLEDTEMDNTKRSSIIGHLVDLNGGVDSLSTESLNIYNVIKDTLDHNIKTYGEYEYSQLLKFCSDLYNFWEGILTYDEKRDYRRAIMWLTDFYEVITDESEEQPHYTCQDYFELIKKISDMRSADRKEAFGDGDYRIVITTNDFYTLSDKLKKWEDDARNLPELYEKVKVKSNEKFGWVTKIYAKPAFNILYFDGSVSCETADNLVKTGYFNMVLKDMFKEIAEENRPNE